MKHTIFSSLSGEKLTALLQSHTAPAKQQSQEYAWKNPKRPKKEWACLIGRWNGSHFSGKLYRSYKNQLSGGIALPAITLTVHPTGGIGQFDLQARFSNSFLLLIAAFLAVAVLQLTQILSALPDLSVVPVLVLVGWLLMLAMICGYTYDQYRHECQAIELTLKTITRSFDK